MSKEKGILFTTEMIQAILSGGKTQTRRVLSPQPVASVMWSEQQQAWYAEEPERHSEHDKQYGVIKLPYHVGDVLYCRETWQPVMATAYRGSDGIQQTPNPNDDSEVAIYKAGWDMSKPGRWRSGRFMPKWAARLWLEVLKVQVERVQDITEEDAIAEGMRPPGSGSFLIDYPRFQFVLAWDKINAKLGYSWESNPWVAVYAFRRIAR